MNCTPLCWPGSRRTIAQRVRMRRGTAVSWRALMVALLALAVSATASAAAVLAPVVSRHGCVSDGTFGCARVRGVSDPVEGGAAISPDGRWLYVPSRRTSAVAVLRLDPVRGTMSQSRSTRGCVAGLHLPPDEGSDAPLRTRGCTPVRGIAMVPKQAVVTPDGRNVYVTATPRYPAEPELDGLDVGIQSVIVLRRLGDGGRLEQPAGASGCVASAPLDGCAVQPGLRATSVSVSPDGMRVYVSGRSQLTVFARQSDGTLVAQSCWGGDAPGRCSSFPYGVSGAEAPVVAPDGGVAYLLAYRIGEPSRPTWALLSVHRDAMLGELDLAAPIVGCITADVFHACQSDPRLVRPGAPVLAPQGDDVYVALQAPAKGILKNAAILRLHRDVNGDLAPAGAPCLSTRPRSSCTADRRLTAPQRMTFSPDGRWLFATNDIYNTLTVLAHDQRSGALQRAQTLHGCQSLFGPCGADAPIEDDPTVVPAPSGRFVYVVSTDDYAAGVVAAFAVRGT